MPAIEFVETTATYRAGPFRRKTAIRRLSVSLTPGLVWGIVGPNGAGKSTLLRLCMGLQAPNAGSVYIDGESPRTFVEREGISYVPDEPRLPASWTPRSMLKRVADLAGFARCARADLLAASLERWGLTPVARTAIRKLSKGTVQRAMLAQAFLTTSRVVVLDEPSNALDLIWRSQLHEQIRRSRDADRTVIIASHDLTELRRLADRLIILDHGAVLGILTPSEVAGARSGGFRLRIATPGAVAVIHAFREARIVAPDEYIIEGAGADDLRRGLVALLDGGAAIAELCPLGCPLEDAVKSLLVARRADDDS